MNQREHFHCACGTAEHQFSLATDGEDFSWLEPCMSHYGSFWSRLWRGLRYIAGAGRNDCHFDTIELTADDLDRLAATAKRMAEAIR